MHKGLFRVFFLALLLSTTLFSPAHADLNLDFGLPLFGFEEIKFEKTKPVDFNLQLLKKFIIEHQGSVLPQLHGISRWFSLIKLSDAPRREQLIKESSSYFALADVKKASSEELLRAIFFKALLLSQDKSADQNNVRDQELEELLLDAEDKLASDGDYSLVKGLSFHLLRNRPNGFFDPMKPEEDLKKALAFIPRTAHYYYVMGQAFRLLGSLDSSLFLAIASFEKSAALDPRNGKLQNSLLGIYMGLHEDYQSRGKPEPFWLEEAVYKKILAVSPQNPHAMNNLGYLYAEYGVNTQLAQELCQKAVDMSPENPGFHDSLGWAAFKNRDYAKAEEELLKSLSLKKNVYEPHYHLATVYYATGNLPKAAEHYEQAIAIRPDSAEALNNLAYLYTEQNRNIKEAVEASEMAVKLEPNNASYLDTLGWAYYRQGNLDKALNLLLKAAQLAPGQGEILLHIGRVYLDKNDFDLAITYLKEAHKSDAKLNDPDNSLYLAIRLKAYHTAMADYHMILGEKAEREKINNILMAIGRLYQEERMYEKAIELTRLCSEIKREERSLSEAVLSSYQMPVTAEKAAEQSANKADSEEAGESAIELQDLEPAIETESEPAAPPVFSPTAPESETSSPASGAALINSKDTLFAGLPPETDHPLVVSFGPGFFDLMKTFIPGCAVMTDKSITVFVTRLGRLARNATIRIESESITGTSMLQLLSNYLLQLNIPEVKSESPDSRQFNMGKHQLFLMAHDNTVYFSRKPLTSEIIQPLHAICAYNNEVFAEMLYNWVPLQKLLPRWVRPLVKNPFAPFTRILTRYTYKNGNLNEFSTATTGQVEDDTFTRNLARQLFAFKLQSQQLGIETTIKLRSDNDMIYVSTDFENVPAFVERWLGKLGHFLRDLLQRNLAQSKCFIDRTLYQTGEIKICPAGGTISTNAASGLVTCTRHTTTPAVPLFLDDAGSCRYSRERLELVIKDKKLLTPENLKDEKFIPTLAEKMQIPLCPSAGAWTIDATGNIICTDHEN